MSFEKAQKFVLDFWTYFAISHTINVDGEFYNDELVSFGQKLHSRNDNRKWYYRL